MMRIWVREFAKSGPIGQPLVPNKRFRRDLSRKHQFRPRALGKRTDPVRAIDVVPIHEIKQAILPI